MKKLRDVSIAMSLLWGFGGGMRTIVDRRVGHWVRLSGRKKI